MDPEHDPRYAKAFDEMNKLGISPQTVRPVLRHLLELYDNNWELIEEDNFRTLVDAIFENEDDKVQDMNKKNPRRVHEDAIESPVNKHNKGLRKDEVLPGRGNERNIDHAKEGKAAKTSSGRKMVESSSVLRDSGYEPNQRVNQAESGSKRKDPNQANSAAGEGRSYTHYEHNDSGKVLKTKRMTVDHEERNATWKKQPSGHSRVSPIQPGSNGPLRQPDTRNKKYESNSGHDHSTMNQINCDSDSEGDEEERVEQQVSRGNKKQKTCRFSDIAKGTENVKITMVDENGNEPLPRFNYCPESITYESAYVHVSLARISEDDCCRRCKVDCLSRALPCACARDTGGEFAYTSEGLLTEKFLRSCISMKSEPRKQDLFYCQVCPLERAKSDGRPGKCKGHLMRKFIKECWRKCSCNMKCGNRVVQRGITRKLEVFSTVEGKGWGLRTLEDLPEGAFVCEYVGEILTNIELYERNNKSSGNEKHVYPVLLDADWATEGVLKDEDALCLDATHHGNVARFINHCCFDGNVIEVPVQIETLDRHYYHLAFFTKRKVNAFVELTWDYGIDFEDEDHPIKAFRCNCGSMYCRDTRKK